MNTQHAKWNLALLLMLKTKTIYATGYGMPIYYWLSIDLACFVIALFIALKSQRKAIIIIWIILIILSIYLAINTTNLYDFIILIFAPSSILLIAIYFRLMHKSANNQQS